MFSLSKSDRNILIIFLLILISAIYSYFYFEKNMTSRSVNSNNLGYISNFKNKSQIRYFSDYFWQEIKALNTPLYAGDSLFTSDNSEIIFILNDGTRITLKPNSLIRLSESKDSLNTVIEVLSGDIESNGNKKNAVVNCDKNSNFSSEQCVVPQNITNHPIKKNHKKNSHLKDIPLFNEYTSAEANIIFNEIMNFRSNETYVNQKAEIPEIKVPILEEKTTEAIVVSNENLQNKNPVSRKTFSHHETKSPTIESQIKIPNDYKNKSLAFQTIQNQLVILKWIDNSAHHNTKEPYYILQVAEDLKFNKKKEYYSKRQNFILKQSLSDGNYFWRVKHKENLIWSETAFLNIVNKDTPLKTTTPKITINY